MKKKIIISNKKLNIIKFVVNNYNMNKQEFLKLLSINSNQSVSSCKKVLENTYLILCDSLKKGQSVNFYGFGKFYVKSYKERCLNIEGTPKIIPAKNVPSFKTGSVFKNIIN